MAMPRPISAIRNSTIVLTLVTAVRPQTSRKVVGIDTSATSRGTTARNEPNTRIRMSSAPSPVIRVSASTPGELPLLLAVAASATRTSRPLTSMRAPAMGWDASARRIAATGGGAWAPAPGRATGYTRAKVVRPSEETKARLPVEA